MIVLLIKFIPRDKIREAHVAFLFKQIITWPIGLVVAEFRLIEYPFRAFTYANKASFIFEFFLYPAICALFVANYPDKKKLSARFLYYFSYCSVLTVIEAIEERYTEILKYIHWSWPVSFITFLITFYMSISYTRWFFKDVRRKDK